MISALGQRLENYASTSQSLGLNAPVGTVDEYLALWEQARHEQFPMIDALEAEWGASIDRPWLDTLALATQVTKKRSAICYQHGRLLYSALRRYVRDRPACNPTVIETGTARGFSALCMARALQDSGVGGKVVTFDVLPHDTPMYWNCIQDLTGPKTRAQLLKDYAELIETYVYFHAGDGIKGLSKCVFSRVHFAFLDSVHTYEHVMAEFASLRARQQAGDMLFFDDYAPDAYPGVCRAADEICSCAGYEALRMQVAPRRGYLIAVKR